MGRKSNARERRDQIIWGLYRCLASNGHEKVTVKMIAESAGLPAGVIHYYFKSKDEIVSTMAEAIVEKYEAALHSRIQESGDIRERVDVVIDFLVDFVFDRDLNRVFHNLIQMAFERRFLHGVMKRMLENYREQVAGVLIEAGAGIDAPYLGAALVAITEGFSVQLMVDPEVFNPSEIRQLLSQAVRFRLPVLDTDSG